MGLVISGDPMAAGAGTRYHRAALSSTPRPERVVMNKLLAAMIGVAFAFATVGAQAASHAAAAPAKPAASAAKPAASAAKAKADKPKAKDEKKKEEPKK